MSLRVASVSFPCRKRTSLSDFAAEVTRHVHFAADAGASVIVFPEYITSSLLSITPDWNAWTDSYLKLFKELSGKTGLHIMGGTHLVTRDGKTTNSGFFFFPDGRVEEQQKLHLTPIEKKPWNLTPGDKVKILKIPGATIAILICYDVEFPELVRTAVRAGAQAILVPSCTDDVQGYYRVRLCTQARTIENQIFAVQAPLVDGWDLRYFEQSVGRAGIFSPCDIPFPPKGSVIEGDWNQSQCVVGDLRIDLIESIRSKGSVTPFMDVRTEGYSAVQV